MTNTNSVETAKKALLLGESYERKSAFQAALNIYRNLMKSPEVSLRVKVNIGNIHFKMRNYQLAVKFYKMALDQLETDEKQTYCLIMHNIGLALVQQDLYSEAVYVFGFIVKESPDLRAYIHLIFCWYALRNRSKIRKYFTRMFTLPNLNEIEQIERLVLLIAPLIEDDKETGFNWCLDVVRISNFAWIADNLEASRTVHLLRNGNIAEAIKYLNKFEPNVKNLTVRSRINLSFAYLNLQNLSAAKILLKNLDTPEAKNNFGVLRFMQGEYTAAKAIFEEASQSKPRFYEPNYNLALVQKKLGDDRTAEQLFEQILKNYPIPSNSMAFYQVVKLSEGHKSVFNNLKTYLELFGLSYPSDAKTLQQIGKLYQDLSNGKLAGWYFQEAYSVNPLL